MRNRIKSKSDFERVGGGVVFYRPSQAGNGAVSRLRPVDACLWVLVPQVLIDE